MSKYALDFHVTIELDVAWEAGMQHIDRSGTAASFIDRINGIDVDNIPFFMFNNRDGIITELHWNAILSLEKRKWR